MPTREEKQWQHYAVDKTMRKARKQIKRNRKPKRVRRKDWSVQDFDALDDLDLPEHERVMPRGERERRRVYLAKAVASQLADSSERESEPFDEPTLVEDAQGQRGIVVEVSSSLCRVELNGRSLLCSVRGSLSAEETGYTNVVAVGDEAVVSENGSEQGVVEAILPRRSVLARPDVFHSHLQQVIVANVDQLLIVASWRNPAIWLELIDRYLIAAKRYDLRSIICVNKIDLSEDVAICREALQPYIDLNYRVMFTSALTGNGVDKLRQALRGRTTVMVGLSGVGKSSLLSAVQPGLDLRTGEVSEQGGQGQHVTTQVTLHRLEAGGAVVDAPGIREFGLAGIKRGELIYFYPEMIAIGAGCRFSDCDHIHEPGCAVKVAVEQGRVSVARYRNYTKIYESLTA